MAVVIRLSRAGTHKAPFYHLVATDSRRPRDGKYLEDIGTFDPTKSPEHIALKSERIAYWMSKGALPSPTVAKILKRSKMTAGATPAAAPAGKASKKKPGVKA
jgi:small subunit ribosomal protein S16